MMTMHLEGRHLRFKDKIMITRKKEANKGRREGGIWTHTWILLSIQFSSVTQSCPTPCNPMDYSMPGLPVHHQLLELTQTHVH